jgi:predicted nucleic acid-binding protein
MATKTGKLEIRVATAQRARYARAAAKAGLDVSSWARSQLDAAAAEVDDLDDDRESTDEEIQAFLDAKPISAASARRMRTRIKALRRARWIIAGTCLAMGLPILTDNWRHFERIEGLEVIRAAAD